MNQKAAFMAKRILSLAGLLFMVSAVLPAASLFVGFNTITPVQVYDTAGKYLQDIGPSGAIVMFPAGGNYFSVTPSADFTSSTLTEYNANLTPVGSVSVSDLITDTGIAGSNLLLSSYGGTVYRLDTSGAVLNSWSTGYSHIGVTSDGTSIFTTEGDTGNLIDVWSTSGTLLRQIATPMVGLYGLGYDSTTGDFWAGSTNYVYQLSSTGSLLATLNLTGDSRTPGGAVHDSLEVGDLIPVPPPTTTPEPSSLLLLFGGGLLLALGFRNARTRLFRLALSCLGVAGASFGAVSVTLTPSTPSGAPVGSTITWKASASDSASSSATLTYQFKIGPSASAMQVVRDYYTYNTFPWTPMGSEGSYSVEVTVHSSTGATGTASASYVVTSRVTGTSPVVSRTNHPLVALYSVPPCAAGRTARVRFKLPSDSTWQATSSKTCNGTDSLNFYVAGMRASSTYQLQQDVFNGPFDTVGPVLSFTTGAVPAGVPGNKFSIAKPYPAPNNTAYPVLLDAAVPNSSAIALPYATDTSGHVIWYLPNPGVRISTLTRPMIGGSIFLLTYDQTAGGASRLLREYDLAGNLVRETNYAAISSQLVARGADPITSIHHETLPLPNGGFGLIGSIEKVANQGAGPVDVLGDCAIVLDSNLQVKWSWSEFDHLDITRPAILGETCTQGMGGCPHLENPKYSVANDWTHSNALWLTPDGNMIISSRHQDWIIKFRYANGTGDGAVLWKLGKDGDFSVSSSDPYPWFSHQHNPEFQSNGLMTVFDNGNTRRHDEGTGNSRGQAWQINESSKTATPVVNIDLGDFSTATGSAALLSNGNYSFNLGFVGNTSSTREYNAAGVLQSQANSSVDSYRSFRMRSLYSQK